MASKKKKYTSSRTPNDQCFEEVETPDSQGDYSKGELRRHHDLYLETGDIVLQVRIYFNAGYWSPT